MLLRVHDLSICRPFRLLCIVDAMRVEERKSQRQQTSQPSTISPGQQTSAPSTIRSVYSLNDSNSVRGRIRTFRRAAMNKDKKNDKKKEGISKRDPYLYDESEDGFRKALGMGEEIPKSEEITQSMVG